jgi:hypothetical protein
LRRLKHAAEVIVAGASDPGIPARFGFVHAATVEDALAVAERRHGADCSIVCVN